jgi:hypothetical protein
MAKSKSDKPYILRWIIGCVAVILLFHLAWAQYLFTPAVIGDVWFTLVDLLLLGGFGYTAVKAYKNADDPNFDGYRKGFIGLTVASSIWAALWSTELMSKIADGIAG